MQFKTKLGLVDIPNEEVLAAADAIRGVHNREAFAFMEEKRPTPEHVALRAEYEILKRPTSPASSAPK